MLKRSFYWEHKLIFYSFLTAKHLLQNFRKKLFPLVFSILSTCNRTLGGYLPVCLLQNFLDSHSYFITAQSNNFNSLLKGPWHHIFELEISIAWSKPCASRSKLAKFEQILCGRKFVFFFLYVAVEPYSSLAMLTGDEMKCTPQQWLPRGNGSQSQRLCFCVLQAPEAIAPAGYTPWSPCIVGGQPEIVSAGVLWFVLLLSRE